MVQLELSMDLYYWMVDKGEIIDDQRNQVDIQQQTVGLCPDQQAKVEGGIYIGRLMHAIRKSILKITKMPFTLDPLLANLKEPSTQAQKLYNWEYIFAGLKRFQIKIGQLVRQLIVSDPMGEEAKRQKMAHIRNILEQLYGYDHKL
jgi:hypothetical protein